ncbi:viral A-type inclusion protein [Clostridium weizhouense]|uniref:Viral A-type inclusion protein n=1 Tax=Clostridium weizhouense TaxID=2859781 RepID=A0ABS7ALT7_9CLOT|nr:viral A-type inclusion protein [Clostridium weizhouense]MBW6408661.1 viral A-type inclusion protein [Clostridium weizhouense]
MLGKTFYKKNDAELETAKMFNEISEKKEFKNKESQNNSKNNSLCILDKETIGYIINKFSPMSVEIRESLNNLSKTLESTIDYIEDKSSNIIKTERNFELSDYYRKISVEVYDMIKNINEYVKWMETEYEHENNDFKETTQNSIEEINENISEIENKNIDNNINFENGIEIYKDFSTKEPKAFKLNKDIVRVDDWDDLLVKTAEILTKKYKESKHSNKTVNKDIKISEKKSNENTFRNTVIEMLNEYKINLNDFRLYC